jgi:dCTP diphosphatase
VHESARLYFAPDADLLALELDPRAITVPIEFARTPRGPMPHVHGPLARAWIRRVWPLAELPSPAPSPAHLGQHGTDSRSYAALQRAVAAFNEARAWRPFHAPKNLAMALLIEAAELAEPFRWDDDEQAWARARSPKGRAHLAHEMGDVLLLLASLAEYTGIDLLEAARDKLALNASRYPEDASRGRADKYTAYARDEAPVPADAAREGTPDPRDPSEQDAREGR